MLLHNKTLNERCQHRYKVVFKAFLLKKISEAVLKLNSIPFMIYIDISATRKQRQNQFNIICDDFFGEKMKENPTLSKDVLAKHVVIMARYYCQPWFSAICVKGSTIIGLESKQPKSMNTEKLPLFKYISMKNLNLIISTRK